MNTIAESAGVYSLLSLDIFVFQFVLPFVQFVAAHVIIARLPGFDTWTLDGIASPSKVRSMWVGGVLGFLFGFLRKTN